MVKAHEQKADLVKIQSRRYSPDDRNLWRIVSEYFGLVLNNRQGILSEIKDVMPHSVTFFIFKHIFLQAGEFQVSIFTQDDYSYMRYALQLAEKARGFTSPNPMVGAVIVKDGRIIGEGYHKKYGDWHAEVNAFDSAEESVEGATMYVTLEPCSHTGKTPPCADKIIEKKIGRVIIGAKDPNPLVSGRGIEKLKNAGIEVSTGLLEEESIKLNEVFMKYITEKRPFVLYKSAVTLDGKIATYTGKSKWISNEKAREEVHYLRHCMSGIMVGINTVIADNPMLNCRTEGLTSPVRIIVDSNLRIPTSSNIVQTAGKYRTIIATLQDEDSIKASLLKKMGAEILRVREYCGRVDLDSLMDNLGSMGIDSILIEGGGTLAFNAFKQGIVDKVIYYISPKIFGGISAKTSVEGDGFAEISRCIKLKSMQAEMLDDNIRITAYVDKS